MGNKQPSSGRACLDTMELVRSQAEALTAYLDSRAVGILIMSGDEPKEVGSGTCVTVGGRYFIATAAHNLIKDGVDLDVRIVHTRKPVPVSSPTVFVRRGTRGGGASDPVDVGFLELSSEDAHALGKSFVGLDQMRGGVHHLTDDNVLVYGYPRDLVDQELLKRKMVRLQPIGYLTPTLPLDRLAGTQPPPSADVDIVFDYPKVGNIWTKSVDARPMPGVPGISGGGVWLTNANEPGVWAPEKCSLIGIEHWWREFEFTRSTQIQHWVDLLRTEVPELADAIAASFPAPVREAEKAGGLPSGGGEPPL